MLNMLIVDDEADIRESLAMYNWSQSGIKLSATVQHGIEALQWIEENHIDLLITDIRMPIMDGLELVKRVRAFDPYIKIIVLSGFDDFDYARTCIRYGVSEYLLKPIDRMKLIEAIDRLKTIFLQEEEREERNRLLEKRSNFLIRSLRRGFLDRLLTKPLSVYEIEDGCLSSEMILEGNSFVVILIRIDQAVLNRHIYTESEWKLITFTLENIITELWDDEGHGYQFINRDNNYCYLITAEHSPLFELLKQIRKQLYRFRGLFRSTLSFAIGQPVTSVADIYLSRQKADKRMLELDEDSFELLNEHDLMLQNTHRPSHQSKNISGSSQNIVNKAKGYIYHNCHRAITLSEVAQAIHVNSSYLSHLFSEVTGNTYVYYLTACRTEKAKELLENSHYKIYEIGELVGFRNPRYFSSIFRKLTGMTPNEYRNQRGT
ncbi:response regulator [Paenibacillus sp. GCM10028914]|uniref:response regulator transcription factor n=1 Tax=Paenibacillus sp. GCM10028914 TaxID=3273416 RepID=UPI003621752D